MAEELDGVGDVLVSSVAAVVSDDGASVPLLIAVCSWLSVMLPVPLVSILLNKASACATVIPGGRPASHSALVTTPLSSVSSLLNKALAKSELDVVPEDAVPDDEVVSEDADDVDDVLLRSLASCSRSSSICCKKELIELLESEVLGSEVLDVSVLVEDEPSVELLVWGGGGGEGGAAFCRACCSSLSEMLPSPLLSISLKRVSAWVVERPEELSALTNWDSPMVLLPPLISLNI